MTARRVPLSLRPRRLIAGSLVAAALAVAASLSLVVPAASAHDELVSSDPAADAVLTAAPSVITLVFTADLLSDGTGAQMEVTDPSGQSVVQGPPTVTGTTLQQSVTSPAASGAYRVLWRVVSSDGHPISGEFAFTVDAPPPPVTTPTPTPTPTPTATAAATPTPTSSTSEAGAAGGASTVVTLLAVVGVGVALAAVAVIVVIVVRGSRRKT